MVICPRVAQNILDVEAKLAQGHIAFGGRAEAVNADAVALRSNVSVPTHARACLDCEARRDCGWQDTLAVVFRLLCEQLAAGHGDNARRRSILLQRLARFERERDFR